MPGSDGLLCIGLLEDDADFREELALGLGGYGFRVAFACDNAAAFYRRLQEQPCDIVILGPIRNFVCGAYRAYP